MSCITTFSGKHLDPTKPDADMIDAIDIAHALSMICRANGHFSSFYSVAQHSINCANEAAARGLSAKIQLACLLHDGSEAYLSDITRPVKRVLKEYRVIEKRIQNLIWEKWINAPLTDEELKQVFLIDDAMLYCEFMYFMNEKVGECDTPMLSEPSFDVDDFRSVENKFLKKLESLINREHRGLAVGVDWKKGKWLAVEIKDEIIRSREFADISDLCREYESADAILIDIPIGLPESSEESLMRPDSAARQLLGGRKSSIFNAPFRQIVYAESRSEAWELNRLLNAKLQPVGLALADAVRQVDRFLQEHENWKNRLLESHPEVAFRILNGKPLVYSKHTPEGLKERYDILTRYNLYIKSLIPDGNKIDDDLLDAACLAITAQLGLRYGFTTLPKSPVFDDKGIKMQMVFCDII